MAGEQKVINVVLPAPLADALAIMAGERKITAAQLIAQRLIRSHRGVSIRKCKRCGEAFVHGRNTGHRATRLYCKDTCRVATHRQKAESQTYTPKRNVCIEGADAEKD